MVLKLRVEKKVTDSLHTEMKCNCVSAEHRRLVY
jgi:hypothetical protein